MKQYITIFTSKEARRLLKDGFTIYDIKPDRQNKERTVFVFENSAELLVKLEEHKLGK